MEKLVHHIARQYLHILHCQFYKQFEQLHNSLIANAYFFKISHYTTEGLAIYTTITPENWNTVTNGEQIHYQIQMTVSAYNEQARRPSSQNATNAGINGNING